METFIFVNAMTNTFIRIFVVLAFSAASFAATTASGDRVTVPWGATFAQVKEGLHLALQADSLR